MPNYADLKDDFNEDLSLYSDENVKILAHDFKILSEVETGGNGERQFKYISQDMNEKRKPYNFQNIKEIWQKLEISTNSDKKEMEKIVKLRKEFFESCIFPTLFDPRNFKTKKIDFSSEFNNSQSEDAWKSFCNAKEAEKFRGILLSQANDEREELCKIGKTKNNKKSYRDDDRDEDKHAYDQAINLVSGGNGIQQRFGENIEGPDFLTENNDYINSSFFKKLAKHISGASESDDDLDPEDDLDSDDDLDFDGEEKHKKKGEKTKQDGYNFKFLNSFLVKNRKTLETALSYEPSRYLKKAKDEYSYSYYDDDDETDKNTDNEEEALSGLNDKRKNRIKIVGLRYLLDAAMSDLNYYEQIDIENIGDEEPDDIGESKKNEIKKENRNQEKTEELESEEDKEDLEDEKQIVNYSEETLFLASLINHAFKQLMIREGKDTPDENEKEQKSENEAEETVDSNKTDVKFKYYDPYWYVSDLENNKENQKSDINTSTIKSIKNYYSNRAILLYYYKVFSSINYENYKFDLKDENGQYIIDRSKEEELNKELKQKQIEKEKLEADMKNAYALIKSKIDSPDREKIEKLEKDQSRLDEEIKKIEENLKEEINEREKKYSDFKNDAKSKYSTTLLNFQKHIKFISDKIYIEIKHPDVEITNQVNKSNDIIDKGREYQNWDDDTSRRLSCTFVSDNFPFSTYAQSYKDLVNDIRGNRIKTKFWKEPIDFYKLKSDHIYDPKTLQMFTPEKLPKSIDDLHSAEYSGLSNCFLPQNRDFLQDKESALDNFEEMVENDKERINDHDDSIKARRNSILDKIATLKNEKEKSDTKRQQEIDEDLQALNSEFQDLKSGHLDDKFEKRSKQNFSKNYILSKIEFQLIKLEAPNKELAECNKEVKEKINEFDKFESFKEIYDEIKENKKFEKQKSENLSKYNKIIDIFNKSKKSTKIALKSVKDYFDAIISISEKENDLSKIGDVSKENDKNITNIIKDYQNSLENTFKNLKNLKTEIQNLIDHNESKIQEQVNLKLEQFRETQKKEIEKQKQDKENKEKEDKTRSENEKNRKLYLDWMKALNDKLNNKDASFPNLQQEKKMEEKKESDWDKFVNILKNLIAQAQQNK